MGPMLLAGIGGGLNLVNRLLNKPKTGRLNPAMYQNLLRFNNQAAAGVRNNAMLNATTANRGNAASIRQAAGAGRLPAGAMLSALGGANYNTARGVASIEPQIAEMRGQSDRNYFDLLNQYSQGQAQEQNEFTDMISGEIGNFTNLGMQGMFQNQMRSEMNPPAPTPGNGSNIPGVGRWSMQQPGMMRKIGMLMGAGYPMFGG
jgi:hypothetical protein